MSRSRLLTLGVAVALLAGCGGSSGDDRAEGATPGPTPATAGAATGPAPTGRAGLGAAPTSQAPTTKAPASALKAGNPNGKAAVPAEARAVDTSKPDRVVGTGTAASCTSKAVIAAVAAGGIITFSCGPDPVTITLSAIAKVRNSSSKVVLDGGGLVTLSGGGKRRILYMNTCDKAQGSAGGDCTNQDHPRLTVQNITFADGNATGDPVEDSIGDMHGGGGAIFARGGRLKVIHSRFVRNRCDPTGPDLGGAAIRVLDQNQDLPVYVVSSTFGGAAGQGGRCSNGGALSSIQVPWIVLNSVFSHNEAIGRGANPARDGTPGGGSGGAIYLDGADFTLRIAGSIVENNHAKEGGGAVFFVSNDRTGTMRVESSTLRRNPSDGFENWPGIFFIGKGEPTIVGSKVS